MATGYTDFAGYTECVEMVNRDVRVVLGPHYGGRVLAYAWHGENALALDPDEDGVTYTPGKENPIGPSGGRFDIGPEMIIPHTRSCGWGHGRSRSRGRGAPR